MSTTIEQPIRPIFEEEILSEKNILSTYFYPKTNTRIEVVGAGDSRIDAAIEIEVAGMAALGDPEQEVRDEFEPYKDTSIFFLAFDQNAAGTIKNLKGMGRIIPANETDGDKSLNDLASIAGWHVDGIPQQEHDGHVRHDAKDVVKAFKAESGCTDMSKVWDISTMALDLNLSDRQKPMVADSIIASFAQEVINAWKRDEVTHAVSFNQKDAHQFFLNLGYPFHNLFKLEPMMYDSFDSGEGMVAQPAWLSIEDLAQTILAAQKRHMGMLLVQPSMAHLHAVAS